MFYDQEHLRSAQIATSRCRPASEDQREPDRKIVSGAVNVYTLGANFEVALGRATAAIDRDWRVSVDVVPGDKTEVTSFRGRTTVSTGKESVVLEGREKVSAEAKTRTFSPKVALRTRRSRPCRRTTGSTT